MSGFSKADVATIVDRDGAACARCGRAVDLHARGVAWSIHHRRPRGMGGSKNPAVNATTNGVVLCGSGTTGCHGWVESHRDEARQQGWLVPQWRDPADVPVRSRRHGWAWLTTTGWVPLTQSELWLTAGQWLADELSARGITDTDVDGVTRLSTAAADLFGVMAGDLRKEAA